MNVKKLQVFKNLTMEILDETEMVSPGYLSFLLCANTDMCLSSSEAKEVLELLKQEGKLVIDCTKQFYGKPSALEGQTHKRNMKNARAQAWETVEVVSGKLIEIDRNFSTIDIEVEDVDPESQQLIYVRRCYDLAEDLSDKDYKKLRQDLDSDVRAKLIDGEVTEVVRT